MISEDGIDARIAKLDEPVQANSELERLPV
jgi:hypothetical protein